MDAARLKEGKNDIAICRIEQLCPFPFRYVQQEIQKFKNASVTWVQEEPKNQGAWSFISPRLTNVTKAEKKADPVYVGRAVSASTSTGYHKQHEQELKAFLQAAMN